MVKVSDVETKIQALDKIDAWEAGYELGYESVSILDTLFLADVPEKYVQYIEYVIAGFKAGVKHASAIEAYNSF